MTETDFRRLALSLPQATEEAHMNHPDFRVGGKIFATLWPGKDRGVVILLPDQQKRLMAASPLVFSPVNGKWGRDGATAVCLSRATKTGALKALRMAWKNRVEELAQHE